MNLVQVENHIEDNRVGLCQVIQCAGRPNHVQNDRIRLPGGQFCDIDPLADGSVNYIGPPITGPGIDIRLERGLDQTAQFTLIGPQAAGGVAGFDLGIAAAVVQIAHIGNFKPELPGDGAVVFEDRLAGQVPDARAEIGDFIGLNGIILAVD